MKFDNNIILTLLFLIIASACNGNKTINNKVKYNIDLDSADKLDSLFLSHYFDTLEIIKLETIEESLIGDISKVKICKDRIVIMDSRIAKRVFVFDDKGKLINKIGGIGNGPGEYTRPKDFVFHEEKAELYVCDGQREKVNRYDLYSGEFRGEMLLKEEKSQLNCLAVNNDRLFAACYNSRSSDDDCTIREFSLNTNQHVKDYSMEFMIYNLERPENLINSNIFYHADGKLLYTHPFSNMLVSIDEDGIIPYLTIISSSFVTHDDLEKLKGKKLQEVSKAMFEMDKMYKIHRLIDFNDWFFLKTHKGYYVNNIFLNKKTEKVVLVDNIINDLKYNDYIPHLGAFYTYGGITDEGIYFYLNFMLLDAMENFSKIDIKTKERLKELNSFRNEDDNPHILYFKFKK